MFLKESKTDDVIEVAELQQLIDPTKKVLSGKRQTGQEEQASSDFKKEDLIFTSGEPLPRCWTDEGFQS